MTDEEKNVHAAEMAKLGASKGGEERAKRLTADDRTAIARAGAAARWGKKAIPRATHDGILRIGSLELPCAVLEGGKRVLSERALAGILGVPRGGKAYTSAKRTLDGGEVLPVYLGAERLRPFITDELAAALFPPIEFIPKHGGRSAFGIKAEVVPQICDTWLKARDAGALSKHQEGVAKKADIIMRGLANVGIIALVDEATGYQDDRARDALAKILEEFIAKELRKWVKTFPTDFYKEMFRLRHWKYPDLPAEQRKRPILVGKYTNNIVYERLAPGVREELHRQTPRDDKGRLKHKLFQRLTEDVGHPKLREHLASVVALMKASDSWQQFMKGLDRALPKYGKTMLLPFPGDEER